MLEPDLRSPEDVADARARAERVWAMEREFGWDPAPIFGFEPPVPHRISGPASVDCMCEWHVFERRERARRRRPTE